MSAHTASAGDRLRDWAEAYRAAWNGRDAGAIDAFVTDDVVWRDPALPEPARGPAGVRAFMEVGWRAFPDLHFEPADERFLIRQGDHLVLPWTMAGTFEGRLDPPGFAPTGRRMRVPGVDLIVLRGERIADYTALYDMNELARRLGIAPSPGSGGERMMVAMQRLQARLMRRRPG
jgi:steroid delta-isomerase-like uncharacterized protein